MVVFHVQNSRSRMPVSAGLPQCVSQDTPQTKPAHPPCPNRFCPNVSVLSEPVLSSDHIMFVGLLPPTMFCPQMFCPPSWFYPPCPPPLRVGGNRKSRGNILAAQGTNSAFLRACFWAFIFGALGRWTELWSRLGQARCVGVMAALPQPPPSPP